MKVILSRKGFDSSSGGIPSPILLSGILLSLPIPEEAETIKYSELKIEQFLPDVAGVKNLLDLLKLLSRRGYIEMKSEKLYLDKEENQFCHLDPDIYTACIDRKKGWREIFGQVGAAQSHLKNQGIQVGDLFLFFGWFRETEKNDGSLKWKSEDKNGRHIIYGYLQVGDILTWEKIKEGDIPDWIKHQPHLTEKYMEKKNNTLYIARERLFIDREELPLPGWGVFYYSESLVLTKKGETRRSYWELPSFFQRAENLLS